MGGSNPCKHEQWNLASVLDGQTGQVLARGTIYDMIHRLYTVTIPGRRARIPPRNRDLLAIAVGIAVPPSADESGLLRPRMQRHLKSGNTLDP